MRARLMLLALLTALPLVVGALPAVSADKTPAAPLTIRVLSNRADCDWSVPGRGQGPTETWLQYGTDADHVYGGAELPPAPADSAGGWMSTSFLPLLAQ